MIKFKPKGKDELRQKVIENYGLNEDDNKDLIDKIVNDRYKDEEFKAAEKNKTANARKEVENYKKGKDFYKKGGKPKREPVQKDEPGSNEPKVSQTDQAYFFAKGGTRTEARYLQKVMKATGKEFNKAQNDGLFTAWKKQNDEKTKNRNAHLGASRGGSRSGPKEDEMEQKFMQNLPPGYKAERKSK